MVNLDIPRTDAEAIRDMLKAKQDIVGFHCDKCISLQIDKANYQTLIDRFDCILQKR